MVATEPSFAAGLLPASGPCAAAGQGRGGGLELSRVLRVTASGGRSRLRLAGS